MRFEHSPFIQRQQQGRKRPLADQLSVLAELLAPCPVASAAVDAMLPAVLEVLGDDALVADDGWPGIPAVALDEPELAGLSAYLGEFEDGGVGG